VLLAIIRGDAAKNKTKSSDAAAIDAGPNAMEWNVSHCGALVR